MSVTLKLDGDHLAIFRKGRINSRRAERTVEQDERLAGAVHLVVHLEAVDAGVAEFLLGGCAGFRLLARRDCGRDQEAAETESSNVPSSHRVTPVGIHVGHTFASLPVTSNTQARDRQAGLDFFLRPPAAVSGHVQRPRGGRIFF